MSKRESADDDVHLVRTLRARVCLLLVQLYARMSSRACARAAVTLTCVTSIRQIDVELASDGKRARKAARRGDIRVRALHPCCLPDSFICYQDARLCARYVQFMKIPIRFYFQLQKIYCDVFHSRAGCGDSLGSWMSAGFGTTSTRTCRYRFRIRIAGYPKLRLDLSTFQLAWF